MSQKQTLSLNAVIDLIQTSGQIVPLEQWIPSCNRSQCTIRHSAPQDTVHHSAPQCTTRHERLRNVARDQVWMSENCRFCRLSNTH